MNDASTTHAPAIQPLKQAKPFKQKTNPATGLTGGGAFCRRKEWWREGEAEQKKGEKERRENAQPTDYCLAAQGLLESTATRVSRWARAQAV
ncbi:hypothetical protein GCM10023185_06600 [Hymenobacter saemangeumensis]|uniref:Uncharacterized protein n=1 Tax=Hymenobacter saemangeumensis TaxID=1084522 RepID=A0ABP8I2E8_9BACT